MKNEDLIWITHEDGFSFCYGTKEKFKNTLKFLDEKIKKEGHIL